VTFTIDGAAQTPVTLSGGTASTSSSSLAVGTHTITAAYSGDTNDIGSSSSLTQTVNKGSTTTSLSSSATTLIPGQSVTFSSTVNTISPATGIPTGSVQFQVNGVNFGTPVTLSAGQATLTTSSLPVGIDNVVAVYSGNTNLNPSTSGPATVTLHGTTEGRVSGNGNIGTGTRLDFNINSDTHRADMVRGEFQYSDNSAKIDLDSKKISFLSIDTTTSQIMFAGTASLDGKKGTYNFVVTATDPDGTGQHDAFSITITDNAGNVVYQKSGTVQGHIEIHKFSDHDDKSDKGAPFQKSDLSDR
jgi:hypothetical protein